ncbi:glucokinase [Pseudemcibacter aquimaris]|uniref:glucokinase n=1 Tax=Pseudemcibacter aquimaris TaxID=2857064 RepID=UPI002012F924|nr:glucokinase [Pseudemcibacter aquimaris]MCC3860362.1 glucokinase [Pseudemcibacter aquimaris]WDU57688.1 glucokinase [Pseudemcibacter aquimaris]
MTSELLVADIGGTNVRFAIASINDENDISLNNINMCPTENWLYLEDAVNDYLSHVGKRPARASIAFAGPVNSDLVTMTNGTWEFKQSELASYLNMEEVKVMNDYCAHACSMPLLKGDQLVQIGGGEVAENGNMVVLGPGTGVGVGALVSVGDKWKAVASEGGHVGFSASGDLEKEINRIIADEYHRVSIEEMVSGRGISNIYYALGIINGTHNLRLHPAEINKMASDDNDPDSVQAIKIFSGMLGSFASDMAGTFNATGGVYLAGGVLPKLKDFFLDSNFREKFEENEKLPFVKDIETHLIMEEYPALFGAAAYYSGMFL